MAKLIFLMFVGLATLAFASKTKQAGNSAGSLGATACDFKFGQSAWEYTEEFHNEEFTLLKNHQTKKVILPADENYIITYVCVKIPSGGTAVSYSTITNEVLIELAHKPVKNVTYKVIAKRYNIKAEKSLH